MPKRLRQVSKLRSEGQKTIQGESSATSTLNFANAPVSPILAVIRYHVREDKGNRAILLRWLRFLLFNSMLQVGEVTKLLLSGS